MKLSPAAKRALRTGFQMFVTAFVGQMTLQLAGALPTLEVFVRIFASAFLAGLGAAFSYGQNVVEDRREARGGKNPAWMLKD